MWETRRLRTPWASTTCYRDSFSFVSFFTIAIYVHLLHMQIVFTEIVNIAQNHKLYSSQAQLEPQKSGIFVFPSIMRTFPY
jgi:hypothetical protein